VGFYFDLRRVATVSGSYCELGAPVSFWALYGIAGFALICMGGAAYYVLADLAQVGTIWDRAIVILILLAIPAYFVVGVKLAVVRRFVLFSGDTIKVGYRFSKTPVFQKSLTRDQIAKIELINQRPSKNVAPSQHEDAQFYVRGHWKILLTERNKRKVVIDRHTEKGALEGLFEYLLAWKDASIT